MEGGATVSARTLPAHVDQHYVPAGVCDRAATRARVMVFSAACQKPRARSHLPCALAQAMPVSLQVPAQSLSRRWRGVSAESCRATHSKRQSSEEDTVRCGPHGAVHTRLLVHRISE